MTTSQTTVAISGDDATANVVRPETWPESLQRLVGSSVRDLPDGEHAGDLELPADADQAVRTLLAGQRLLTYHATRLLDHGGIDHVARPSRYKPSGCGGSRLPVSLDMIVANDLPLDRRRCECRALT